MVKNLGAAYPSHPSACLGGERSGHSPPPKHTEGREYIFGATS